MKYSYNITHDLVVTPRPDGSCGVSYFVPCFVRNRVKQSGTQRGTKERKGTKLGACYREKSFANKSLRSDVSHCRKHGDASVLQFGLAAALEVLHAAIGGEACGIPKSDWVLHTELVLERTQRRCGVVGPVTPGASGQTILPCENKNTYQMKQTSSITKRSKYPQMQWVDHPHKHTKTLAYTMTLAQADTSTSSMVRC